MDKTLLALHKAPRDRFDWRLNLMVLGGTALAVVLLQVLLLIIWPPLWMLFAAIALLWAPIKLAQMTLLRLETTDDGFYAVRPFRRGALIPWSEVESVEELDREAYLRKSLRCLVNADLAPPSGTFSGVFEIKLKSGRRLFFPPENRELFERKLVWKLRRSQPLPRYYATAETEETPNTVSTSRRWWQ